MKNKKCVDCGKIITRWDATRCRSCARKGNLNPRWKGGLSFCKDCGKQITRGAIHCHFCNNKNNNIMKCLIGKKHPNWKGGSQPYYSDVANRVYREHHLNVICEKCSSPNNIHIHHRDVNQKNNNINNLQALCRSCHSKIHHKIKKEVLYDKR